MADELLEGVVKQNDNLDDSIIGKRLNDLLITRRLELESMGETDRSELYFLQNHGDARKIEIVVTLSDLVNGNVRDKFELANLLFKSDVIIEKGWTNVFRKSLLANGGTQDLGFRIGMDGKSLSRALDKYGIKWNDAVAFIPGSLDKRTTTTVAATTEEL